jgi:hypothetical protein
MFFINLVDIYSPESFALHKEDLGLKILDKALAIIVRGCLWWCTISKLILIFNLCESL